MSWKPYDRVDIRGEPCVEVIAWLSLLRPLQS
jgi:hypothetical protein